MFGHKWERAAATIIEARSGIPSKAGAMPGYEFVAEVRKVTGEVFRATINAPAQIQAPAVGAVVSVEVEAKTGQVRLDPHSTMGTLRAVGGMLKAAQQARWQAEYGAQAASGTPGGMGGGPGPGGMGAPGAAPGPMQQALFTAFGQNGQGIAVTASPEMTQLAQKIRSGDPAQRAAALAELRQRATAGNLPLPGMASPGTPGGIGPAGASGSPAPAGTFGAPGPAPSTFDPVSPINTFNSPVSPVSPVIPGHPGGLGDSFSAGARTDQAERLTRLKALKDQGLLSLVEYESQRQRILNEL
jgi:hypothetical protein